VSAGESRAMKPNLALPRAPLAGLKRRFRIVFGSQCLRTGLGVCRPTGSGAGLHELQTRIVPNIGELLAQVGERGQAVPGADEMVGG